MGQTILDSELSVLTCNLSGKIRREKLDGRSYLVAPLSMIVPGVLNGSKGPLYYPLDEITKSADAWNGIPIVCNHPVNEEGKPCSARSPRVLEKYGLGHVFNVSVNGKLSAEGWFDEAKVKQISPSTHSKLIRGEVEELSTGLFTDNEAVRVNQKALYKGKQYTATARNHRPDHLAILPDTKGACSVEDGCGMNMNEEGVEVVETEENVVDWDAVDNANSASGDSVYLEDSVLEDDSTVLISNQLSHGDLRDRLSVLVGEKFGKEAFVQDVFSKSVVYGMHPKRSVGELVGFQPSAIKNFRIGYKANMTTGEVTLDEGMAKEVMRSVEFKPVSNESDEPDDKKWFELIGNTPGHSQASHGRSKGGGSGSGSGLLGDKKKVDALKKKIGNAEDFNNGKVSKFVANKLNIDEAEVLLGKNGFTLRGGLQPGSDFKSRFRLTDPSGKTSIVSTDDIKKIITKNQSTSLLENDVMPLSKKEMVTELITNCGCWVENDREALEAISEDKLSLMHNESEQLREFVENADVETNTLVVNALHEHTDDELTEEMAKRKKKKEMAKNETIETSVEEPTTENAATRLTPEEQQDISFARGIRKDRTNVLMAKITSNENNAFSEEYLLSRSLDELTGMAALASNEKKKESGEDGGSVLKMPPSFIGSGGITENLSKEFSSEDQEMVPVPTNYSS